MGMELDLMTLVHQAPTITILLIVLYFARENFNSFKKHVYGALKDQTESMHKLELKLTKLEAEQNVVAQFTSAIQGLKKED